MPVILLNPFMIMLTTYLSDISLITIISRNYNDRDQMGWQFYDLYFLSTTYDNLYRLSCSFLIAYLVIQLIQFVDVLRIVRNPFTPQNKRLFGYNVLILLTLFVTFTIQ